MILNIIPEVFIQIILPFITSYDIPKLYSSSKDINQVIKLNNKYIFKLFWKNVSKYHQNGYLKSLTVYRDNIPISYNEYLDNGNKKIIGIYKNGKKEGIWKSWHENGNIHTVVPYLNGKLNGYFIEYRDNGKVVSYNRYINGIYSSVKDRYFDI